MKEIVTLYNRDKKGNPIEWSIEWDNQDNWYCMYSGRVNGAITATKPTFCFGKNKGRLNETTDVTQCIFEVQSRIEKQRKKGFQDVIPNQKRFEVTLAKEFNARKKFIKFPQLVSAKLDGFRCYITKDGMFSRTHHQILSCPHIFDEIKVIFESFEDLIIDGELYSHTLKDDFNKIASLLSRTKNLDTEFLQETKEKIKFHVFDIHQISNKALPFKQRLKSLLIKDTFESFLSPFKTDANAVFDYFIAVNQFSVNSFEEVEQYLDKAIEEGFEGIMLRNPDMSYENGRSSNLIKYKRFMDSEYEVVDIQDGVGNAVGQASTLICKDKNGVNFSIGMGKGWDETAKRDLYNLKENYIGKMATVIYQELTPDEKIPRFGKLKSFRNE